MPKDMISWLAVLYLLCPSSRKIMTIGLVLVKQIFLSLQVTNEIVIIIFLRIISKGVYISPRG
jgi:hypothetical protein